MSTNPVALLRAITEAHDVAAIAAPVLDHPGFATWSASSHPNLHHYGQGGLAQHTYEVVSLCLGNRIRVMTKGGDLDSERAKNALLLAALYHDFGKLYDYEEDGKGGWRAAQHKHTIHHICRSAIHWSKTVEKTGLCRDIEDDVLHAILAHHGQKAWGSPVEPRTRIAWLLHLCDNLSARMADCDTIHLPRK